MSLAKITESFLSWVNLDHAALTILNSYMTYIRRPLKTISLIRSVQYSSIYKQYFVGSTKILLPVRCLLLFWCCFQVLPSLLEKKDGILLQELERRWSNHKTMTFWLSRFFHYLDRYFTTIQKLPSLKEISSSSFYDLVIEDLCRSQTSDYLFHESRL